MALQENQTSCSPPYLRAAMCTGETNPTPTPAAPHVALLSSPGMGHVLPLAELARRLHETHGFTATLLTYASSDSASQRAFLSSSLPPSAVRSLSLPRVPLDDLPAGSAIETLLSVEAQRSVPALAAVLSDLKTSNHLVAFVADLFGADTLQAARDVGVPGYIFFPSNLLMLSLMLHLPRLLAAGDGEFRDNPEPVRLPGCVAVPGEEILQPLQDRRSEACRWMVHHGERYRDADGILVNTFDAAEPGAAAVLRATEHGRPPVYPVGPITRLVEEEEEDETGCLEWLDEQPERSVLFVSFGSGGTLTMAQTRELARGLEISGERFLWVVRSPVDATVSSNPGESYYDGARSVDDPLSHLPAGFVSTTTRTKAAGGRGRVVRSWAPQGRVLGHGATAAMVTHCGWNSVLESVVSGVPMVAWPLYAEQRQNAVMLCGDDDDETTTGGAAVALRPRVRGGGGDGDAGLVLAEDVADVVREMMHGEKGAAVRAKVAELRDAAATALRPGGLSYETLAQVVSKWKEEEAK